MKPSIETMLQMPYDEALEEIEGKIAMAVNKRRKTWPEITTTRIKIIKYIVTDSEENCPLTNIDIQNVFPAYRDYISSSIITILQRRLDGFIGRTRIRKNTKRETPAYFFRAEVADIFKEAYGKEPGYKPLKDIFLKTLERYNPKT
ncbi:MAG: hypothetical protein U9P44_01180 [archaeon]|nr:hypothetical protein [archaeon]